MGGQPSRPAAARCARPAPAPRTSSPSASPISARPHCCGSARPGAPCIAPSSGRIGAPPIYARGLKPPAMRNCSRPRPDFCSIRIFPAPSSLGCSSNVAGAADRAARGELAFGTVDSYLLWRLTGGKVHATDATNASRTLLFDIHDGRWDERLLQILDVPESVLPQVRDSSAAFGMTDPEFFGAAIPICGIAGDQQAALIGQACFSPGMLKATYGTGCFALLNTGDTPVKSAQQAPHHHRLSARRQAQLRARGLDLHRRRRGAMAARRLAYRADRRRDGRARGKPRTRRRRSFSFRLSSASARLIGGRMCAARCLA